MKKLRLLITQKCNRSCPGCCNKQWDLNTLPIAENFQQYDEIYITGGETMLFQDEMLLLIQSLKTYTKAKIYVYTADISLNLLTVLKVADGITLTVHTERDWKLFKNFDFLFKEFYYEFRHKSLRLNIFEECKANSEEVQYYWKVKNNIEWIEDCPLPKDEEFKRIKILL